MVMEANLSELNRVTDKIIGAAIEVHRQLGPGLLESTYEKCLIFEFQRIGLVVESQLSCLLPTKA
jgi:GxxExxY protein